MTATSRFVLAKYVPDMRRMEPRNIGVFLWVRGRIRCRFLEHPAFVNDLSTFQRWTSHWISAISGKSITPLRGPSVPVSDPTCVDALLSTQKGNYVLADAGEMLESIRLKDIDHALDFLFEELVSPTDHGSNKVLHQSLARECDLVIKEAGIRDIEGFRPKFPIECPVYGVKKRLKFSYGIAVADRPTSLYQRVSIDHDPSAHDAAFKIHAATEHAIVNKDDCFVLIQSSQIARSTNGAAGNLKLLENLCPVVDIDDRQSAIEQLRKAVAGSSLHVVR